MTEHMFGVGVGRGVLSEKRRQLAKRVAKKHGADFAGNPDLPGQGATYWFTCPNRGDPFNGMVARAVEADLEKAGWNK